ncbi:efflux RND transporter permease subunit [Paraferrimonas sedimenticola]|uniref:efflux RND transporter permease subunit n=1 Tax=Paraferrimonas sedimenticola TaxID=375674 RepID=UPI000BA8EBE9|nr:MMPL family transporter [Paraferrimonas sedimenticola]
MNNNHKHIAQPWFSALQHGRLWPWVLAWLAVLAISVVQASRIQIQTDISAYFDPKAPTTKAFDAASEAFDLKPQLLLFLSQKQAWPNSKAQQQLPRLIHQIEQLEGVESTSGYAATLGERPLNQWPAGLAKHFISEDKKSIVISIQPQSWLDADKRRLNQFMNQLDNLVDPFTDKHVLDYAYSGELTMNWQYAKVIRTDLSRFGAGLLLLLALLLGFVIRHRTWLATMLVCALTTLVMSLGFAGWAQLSLAAISAFVPVVIVILSLAYTSHLYFSWCFFLPQMQGQPVAALNASLRENLAPLFWGSLTTILGFLALTMSPSPPIAHFGLLVAFAVAANFVVSLGIISVGLGWVYRRRDQVPQSPLWNRKVLSNGVRLSQTYRKPMQWLAGIATVCAIGLTSQLNFDDNPLSYFDSDNPFSRGKHAIDKDFYGVNTVHWLVSAKPDQATTSFYDADYRRDLRTLVEYLNDHPKVRATLSMLDAANSGAGVIGLAMQSRARQLALAEQTKLYNESLGATRLTLFLEDTTSNELLELERELNTWLQGQSLQVELSPLLGRTLLFAQLSKDNTQRMLQAFVLALSLVFLVVLGLRRNLYIAFVAVLANLIPLLWAFAIWRLMGGQMSLGAAVVMGMIFGVVVDDSFHVLLKTTPYRYGFQRRRRLMRLAPAITLTSLALVVGFALGLLSEFAPIGQLGLLSAMVIGFAWLFDLWLLPQLLPKQAQYSRTNPLAQSSHSASSGAKGGPQ